MSNEYHARVRNPVFRIGKVLSALLLFLAFAGTAFCGNTARITIYYSVQAVNEISIDDASVTLAISGAPAGGNPATATATTNYDITTNGGTDSKKLTAALDTDMPADVTLSMNVAGPADGISAGPSTITSSPSDVVTMIDSVAQSNIPMEFQLSATISAGMVSSGSRTLTLTLADQR
jgi:hypothetical protein